MNLTTKIVLGATVGLLAYDLYAAISPEEGDTISEVVAKEARKRPIIAVGVGVVIGHLFWALESVGGDNKPKGVS
jgi:hypothetical protein